MKIMKKFICFLLLLSNQLFVMQKRVISPMKRQFKSAYRFFENDWKHEFNHNDKFFIIWGCCLAGSSVWGAWQLRTAEEKNKKSV